MLVAPNIHEVLWFCIKLEVDSWSQTFLHRTVQPLVEAFKISVKFTKKKKNCEIKGHNYYDEKQSNKLQAEQPTNII